jgi:hypothetical protein
MTTEELKLENTGVSGYEAVSLGDFETRGTTHLTAQCHSPKDPIPQKRCRHTLKFQF